MIDINKFKKLGFGDSISLKGYINRPHLSFLQDELCDEIEKMEVNDKYITYFFIDIFASDLEEDSNTKIGFIKGCIIQPESLMIDSNFYDTCDAESEELEEMASTLVDEECNMLGKYANSTDYICYVSDFYIYKKFRECGIGSYVINQLDDILYYYSKDFITKIILLPKPRVIDNQRHTKNISEKYKKIESILKDKLIKFYSDNGFKKIYDTDYMIKSFK